MTNRTIQRHDPMPAYVGGARGKFTKCGWVTQTRRGFILELVAPPELTDPPMTFSPFKSFRAAERAAKRQWKIVKGRERKRNLDARDSGLQVLKIVFEEETMEG